MLKQLLRYALNYPSVLFSIIDTLDTQFIRDPFIKTLVKEIKVYHKQYGSVPSIDSLRLIFETNYPNHKELLSSFNEFRMLEDSSNLDSSLLQDKLLDAVRREGLETLLIDTAKLLNKSIPVDFTSLWYKLEKLVNSTVATDLGLAGHTNIANNIMLMRDAGTFNRIPTNEWVLFDSVIGGVGRQELMLFIAPSGYGKTTFLANLASTLLRNADINIFIITTELMPEIFMNRIYRRMLGMTREEFNSADINVLSRQLAQKLITINAKFHIYYAKPNSLTPLQIRGLIDQYKMKYNQEVDVLIVDYLDKLKLPGKRELRHELQELTESLRDIAIDENLALITPTQSNREALKKKGQTSGLHVSESIGKHQSADVVITQQQSEDDRQNGVFTLRFDKVREGNVPQTQVLRMKIDVDSLVISEDVEATLALWEANNIHIKQSVRKKLYPLWQVGPMGSSQITE